MASILVDERRRVLGGDVAGHWSEVKTVEPFVRAERVASGLQLSRQLAVAPVDPPPCNPNAQQTRSAYARHDPRTVFTIGVGCGLNPDWSGANEERGQLSGFRSR